MISGGNMGIYVFGCYYTDEEVEEILTNSEFKGTLVRSALELRVACNKFAENFKNEPVFKLGERILELLNSLLECIKSKL
jgi:hypothetical protein